MNRVGVVVAVRNNAPTIAAALTSVLEQVPSPGQVLVIDGGSTDGTAEIAAALGVRVESQTGTGLGHARNQGIAALTGELVAFCDGDDRWAPGALARRLDHLAGHPGCGAVTGHYVSEEVEPTGADGPALPTRSTEPRPALTPAGLLVRRRTLDEVGPFAEHLRIGTDSDWFVRLRQSTARLDVIDDVVLIKGVRQTSLSVDVAAYRREMLDVARGFLDRRRGTP